MLRIALCDNDKSALPVIAGAAESAFKAQGISAEVTGFTSGKELLKAIDTVPFQIALLDIDMPELDGIEVGKRLRSKNETVEIVYVSECENRVFESFSVFPLGFVRKSNFLNDIADIVRLYIRKYAKKQKADQLKFTTRSSVQVVTPPRTFGHGSSSHHNRPIFHPRLRCLNSLHTKSQYPVNKKLTPCRQGINFLLIVFTAYKTPASVSLFCIFLLLLL